MKKKRYSEQTKNQVEQMRRSGKTYAEIQKVYPIPKSTLSAWLGEKFQGLFDRKAQLEHLKYIRTLSAAKLRREKILRDKEHSLRGITAAQSFPIHDIGFQKALLAMLHWAEGAKYDKASALKFVNTDPRLAHLYITLLRNCFTIDEEKIRIRLHLHYYHNKKETVRFWSNLLGVPPTRFGKLYIKKRSKTKKFRKNFMGICFITYYSAALWKEVMAIGPAIHDLLIHPPGRNRTRITGTASLHSIH